MSGDPAFVRRTVTGVTVELRAQPRARRTALDCAGGALKAQVTAPAEDGKANAAVIELLAIAVRLPHHVLLHHGPCSWSPARRPRSSDGGAGWARPGFPLVFLDSRVIGYAVMLGRCRTMSRES